MLIIGAEQINSLISRLNDSSQLSQCQDEVRRMLEIKSELLWWAESGKCCKWQVRDCLDGEVQILENILTSLLEGDISQALSLLRGYLNRLEEAYG